MDSLDEVNEFNNATAEDLKNHAGENFENDTGVKNKNTFNAMDDNDNKNNRGDDDKDDDDDDDLKYLIMNKKNESVEEFLERLPPCNTSGFSWINYCRHDYDRKYTEKVDAEKFLEEGEQLLQTWKLKHLSGTKLLSVEIADEIKKLAQKHFYLVGKWMLFFPERVIDYKWKKVCQAVQDGRLGHEAYVSLKLNSSTDETRYISVYTEDFTDYEHVKNVLLELIKEDLVDVTERPIHYKCEAYTSLKISRFNFLNLRPSIYSSKDILIKEYGDLERFVKDVPFMKKKEESVDAFLERLPPSTTIPVPEASFIFIYNPKIKKLKQHPLALTTEKRQLLYQFSNEMKEKQNARNPKSFKQIKRNLTEKLNILAKECNMTSGRWKVDVEDSKVDKIWRKVVRAVVDERICSNAAVNLRSENGTRTVFICTDDYSNKDDVTQVLRQLINLEVIDKDVPVYYKWDAFNHLNVKEPNEFGFRSSLYCSVNLLRGDLDDNDDIGDEDEKFDNLDMEEELSKFYKSSKETTEEFLQRCQPSSTFVEDEWNFLFVHNPKNNFMYQHPQKFMYTVRINHMNKLIVELPFLSLSAAEERILQLENNIKICAQRCNMAGGYWILHVDKSDIDNVWKKLVVGVVHNRLGSNAGIELKKPNEDSHQKHAIHVMTENYTDVNDVRRVLLELISLDVVDFNQLVLYKWEAFENLELHIRNECHLSEYLYSSHSILNDDPIICRYGLNTPSRLPVILNNKNETQDGSEDESNRFLSPENNESIEEFLQRVKPSTSLGKRSKFINVKKPGYEDENCKQNVSKELIAESYLTPILKGKGEDELKAMSGEIIKTIDEVARKFSLLEGGWRLSFGVSSIDEKWEKVWQAVLDGRLGPRATVEIEEYDVLGYHSYLINVYNEDYTDSNAKKRILLELIDMKVVDIKKNIHYYCEAYGLLPKLAWYDMIPKIYDAHSILRDEEGGLEKYVRDYPLMKYSNESTTAFIERLPPSKTLKNEHLFVYIYNPYIKELTETTETFSIAAANILYRYSCLTEYATKYQQFDASFVEKQQKQLAKGIENLAIECHLTQGRWILHVDVSKVDEIWSKIVRATVDDHLFANARFRLEPPGKERNLRQIDIINDDFKNVDDIKRIVLELIKLGVIEENSPEIYYKWDAFDYLDLASEREPNEFGLYPILFSSATLLNEGVLSYEKRFFNREDEANPRFKLSGESVNDFLSRMPPSVATEGDYIYVNDPWNRTTPHKHFFKCVKLLTPDLKKYIALEANDDAAMKIKKGNLQKLIKTMHYFAQKCKVTSGFWLVDLEGSQFDVDNLWKKVVEGVTNKQLGCNATLSLQSNFKQIKILSEDFTNKHDVKRILLQLIELGIVEKHRREIFYQCDIINYLNRKYQKLEVFDVNVYSNQTLLTEGDMEDCFVMESSVENTQEFLNRLPPSTTLSDDKYGFIYIYNPKMRQREQRFCNFFDIVKRQYFPNGAIAKKSLCDNDDNLKKGKAKLFEKISQFAKERNVSFGSWIFPVPTSRVDEIWLKIVQEIVDFNRLGINAAVTLKANDEDVTRMIYVETRDFTNKNDVKRVLLELINLKVIDQIADQEIFYKWDAYRYLDYNDNDFGISSTVYSSKDFLSKQTNDENRENNTTDDEMLKVHDTYHMQGNETPENFLRRLPLSKAAEYEVLRVYDNRRDKSGQIALVKRGRVLLDEYNEIMRDCSMDLKRKYAADLQEKIIQLAKECNLTEGCWFLFIPAPVADDIWLKVVKATVDGRLGIAAKANGKHAEGNNLIKIITKDFSDENDVLRILKELENLGLVSRPISYKITAFSNLHINKNNEYGLSPTMYFSNQMLKKPATRTHQVSNSGAMMPQWRSHENRESAFQSTNFNANNTRRRQNSNRDDGRSRAINTNWRSN